MKVAAVFSTVLLVAMSIAASEAQTRRVLDYATPVTDPIACSLEYTERFRMRGVDYCAPRVGSLRVFGGEWPREAIGATTYLVPETFANFAPPPFERGKPNPEWRRRFFVSAEAYARGFGVADIYKSLIKRDFDAEPLSSLDDVRRDIDAATEAKRNDPRAETSYVVQLEGLRTMVDWIKLGEVNVEWDLAPRVAGNLRIQVHDFGRIEALFAMARRHYRRCEGPVG